jgi:WD40 repeat protein
MTPRQQVWATVLMCLAASLAGCSVDPYSDERFKEAQEARMKQMQAQTKMMGMSGVPGMPGMPQGNTSQREAPVTADAVRVVIRTGHAGGILAIAMSPNGRYIASGGKDGLGVWDVASGQEILNDPDVTMHEGSRVEFSADSSKVIIGRVINWTHRGVEVVEVSPASEEAQTSRTVKSGAAAMSPEERFDAYALMEEALTSRTMKSGAAAMSPEERVDAYALVAKIFKTHDISRDFHKTRVMQETRFSPDKQLLAFASDDGTAKLLEFPSGRVVKSFQATAINFSPDGRALVLGAAAGGVPFVHDLASGKETHMASGGSRITDLALAPDGRFAVAGMEGGSAKLWDLTTGKIVRSFDCPDGVAVTGVAVSSAMPVMATGCRDGSAWLWNLATGQQLRNLLPSFPTDPSRAGILRPPVSVRVSRDGRTLAMAIQDRLAFWDLVSGKEARRITLPAVFDHASETKEESKVFANNLLQGVHPNWILSLGITSNGQLMAVRGWGGYSTATFWDLRTGQQVDDESAWSAPQADRDVVTGQEWRTVNSPHSDLILGNELDVSSQDGLTLLSGGIDGAVHVRSPREEFALLIALGREDFVTVTPDNYYLASKAGIKGVAFRIHDKFYPFEQFDLRFNRPDIVLQRLGKASPQLIQSYRLAHEKRLKKMGFTEQMLNSDFHLPQMEVLTKNVPVSVSTAMLTLRVKATDSQYPLDRLNVFVNDVPIYGTAGLPLPNRQTRTHEQELTVPLVQGRNKIQVSVLNQQGVESLKQTVYTTSTAPAPPQDIYVVAIGVSEYKNKAYNLRYAAKDARDLMKAYQAVGQKPAHGKVHVLNLTDQKAIRAAILQAKAWLKQSKVTDLVVVFAAGHGMTDEQANYYFGTHDIDPDHPAVNGLPYEEFENLLDGIPALQKVLLLDTCFSGEIEKDQAVVVAKAETGGSGTVKMRAFKAGRGVAVQAGAGGRLSAETVKFQQDWFADLRRGTGAAVISSSSGDEYSLEGEQWQNGVFTYAVLQGLKNGAADTNKDRTITVSELQGYVIEQVRTLTVGGQNPTARRENLDYDFAVY